MAGRTEKTSWLHALAAFLDSLMAGSPNGHRDEPLSARTDRAGIRFWPSEALGHGTETDSEPGRD